MVSRSSSPAPSGDGLCPICTKPAVERFRPFCSRRCANVDLNRWLSGVYAVPAVEAEDEELDVEPPEPQRER
jgi:endogenous inhibitor of DNA gyrase (YacG/DUF329 family)